jgi:hypothetical protein
MTGRLFPGPPASRDLELFFPVFGDPKLTDIGDLCQETQSRESDRPGARTSGIV